MNSEIKEILKSFKIDYNEGSLILLAIYYYLNKPLPDYIPTQTYLRVLSTGIVNIDDKGNVIWNVPLFEEQITNFEWVKDFREAFKKRNSERAGTLESCIKRMKEFFAKHPHVRVDDVKAATQMYFRSIKDPQYLITSQKFIYDGMGVGRNSHLEEWLEKYYESLPKDVSENTITRKMQ